MGVIYWIYPNLVLANSSVGVEVIDILPAGSPTRCTVRHSWLARVPAADDATRSGYDMIFAPSMPRCVTRTSRCCPNAGKVSGKVSMTT